MTAEQVIHPELTKTPQYTDYTATWWGQAPGGNWYWRAEVPARHLPGHVVQLRTNDLKYLERDGELWPVMPRQQGDTAIWCYPGNTTRGCLMAGQRAAGYRVLIEVDDSYLINSPPIPRKNTSWQKKHDKSITSDKHSFEDHARLAAIVDGIIVTTETLAEQYRPVNEHVYVCRNSVDPDDWEDPDKPDNGVFRIGYAASHSHWWDFAEVDDALGWAAHQPGVEVLIYGIDREPSWPHKHVGWTTDLAAYRRSLQMLDVGVCPLRPGQWANCKSDIKVMEYAMSGAASVISRTLPYVEWWDRPECLTASTAKDFLKQIKWCVANQDGVREFAQKAKQRILAERTIQHEIGRWREAVDDHRHHADDRT